MKDIKKSSSKWIKDHEATCRKFAWQGGYGVFSPGQSQLNRLIRYIDRQKKHHNKQTYQEELMKFFEKYQIEYDVKYIWD